MKKIKELRENIDRFIGERKLHYTLAVIFSKYICGFSAKNYFFYELYKKSHYAKKQYMTDRQMDKFEKINNSSKEADLLVDKYKFNNFFREYVNRDFLYLKDVSLQEFSDFCHNHSTFVLKKNWLCEGQGISKHTLKSDVEIVQFFNENREHVLVEEPIKQHKKLLQLHPESVNTVRVSTLFANGRPHIVSSALRIGTGNNCTDNIHNAGLGCAVDRKTGIVISRGFDKYSNKYLRHPDTGELILGFEIPNWDIVIKTVLKAAQKIPTVKWIGWDVAITDNSCTIVEGNTIQDVDLIQVVQEGLWPRIKELYDR